MNAFRFSFLALGVVSGALHASSADRLVYFGSHSSGPGAGFSLAHFDSITGVLSKPEFLLEAKEPSFFVIHPDGQHLYACNSGKPGGVSAYRIDPATGRLFLLNQLPSIGSEPCFISLDQTGQVLLVANYEGGNVVAFSLRPDGSLGERTAFSQHVGRGPNAQRQSGPFAHSIITDPSNRFALSADLGADKIYIYRFGVGEGSLRASDPEYVSVTAGSGPRHIRFHPNGQWAYVINELNSTIVAFHWGAEKGELRSFQGISTLPADFKGSSTCAELQVHPNGKFLYGSNRGDDSLAAFSIDPATGRLTFVQRVSSGGRTPRNFTFDPSGRWIICTNQDGKTAMVFGVDPDTGRLTPKGEPVPVASSYCVRFLPVQ